MKKMILVSLLILSSLGACKKGTHENQEHFQEIRVNEPPQDLKIPSLLWDLLEEKKVIDSKGKAIANPEVPSKLEENVFVGITVRLREKTPGILGGHNIELKSPKYGMKIDLANYIKMEKGTFNLSIEPAYTVDSTAQVFFLSQSLQLKTRDQNLGSGCGNFFDITKAYLSQFREKGVDVNVTDGRHISFLAGTFFIRVSRQNGVRAFTHLTITDSKYPTLECDGDTEATANK